MNNNIVDESLLLVIFHSLERENSKNQANRDELDSKVPSKEDTELSYIIKGQFKFLQLSDRDPLRETLRDTNASHSNMNENVWILDVNGVLKVTTIPIPHGICFQQFYTWINFPLFIVKYNDIGT